MSEGSQEVLDMGSLDQFDETDLSSYYVKGLKKEETLALLKDESEGVFLVRDSSKEGCYVVCVKENSKVMEYLVNTEPDGQCYIRQEFKFKDLPTLISFYKRNMFTATALVHPVSQEKISHYVKVNTVSERRTVHPVPGFSLSETPTSATKPAVRRSAPPESCGTIYARVTKGRVPISYNSQDLTLHVGDFIRIFKVSHGQGYGEVVGEQLGKKGYFPLINVEILKDGLEKINIHP